MADNNENNNGTTTMPDGLTEETAIKWLRSLPADQALRASGSITDQEFYFFFDGDGHLWQRESEWPLAHLTTEDMIPQLMRHWKQFERVPRTEAVGSPDVTEPTITTALRDHEEFQEITLDEYLDINDGGSLWTLRRETEEEDSHNVLVNYAADNAFCVRLSLSSPSILFYRLTPSESLVESLRIFVTFGFDRSTPQPPAAPRSLDEALQDLGHEVYRSDDVHASGDQNND